MNAPFSRNFYYRNGRLKVFTKKRSDFRAPRYNCQRLFLKSIHLSKSKSEAVSTTNHDRKSGVQKEMFLFVAKTDRKSVV